MVYLNELLDPAALAVEIEQGYVTERKHPTLPLAILNYGAKTQHAWRWNDVTEQCRGLIYDTRDGRVVARPFKKFFSADQLKVAGIDIPADEPFTAYEKLDGSLGISYCDDDGKMYIATRGSFVSEQAVEATRMLREYEADSGLQLTPTWTFLFEIIYPQNRVVVDYANRRALVLLAMIDTTTGEEMPDVVTSDVAQAMDFDRPSVYDGLTSFHEALSALDDDTLFKDREGMVLRFNNGLRVKLKTADYLHYHRLVTRVTPKRIWEHVSSGLYYKSLTYGLWSEPSAWIERHAERLVADHKRLRDDTYRDYEAAKEALGQLFFERKAFAKWVQLHVSDRLPLLFLLYDGKDDALDAAIWKRLKPKGDEVFRPESA